jgi:hypothetical protein
MKAIINGKRYDTEKSEEIARGGNGLSPTDFNHYEETLYRTNKGSWFLVGGGGPASKYAKPVGSGGHSGSSDNFVALTDKEAYQWLEDHGETEALEQYYSDQIEDA